MLVHLNRVQPWMLVIASLLPLAGGCGGGDQNVPKASIEANATTASSNRDSSFPLDSEPVALTTRSEATKSPAQSQAEFYPEVLIKTGYGDVRVKLNAEKAPRTVENFLYNYVHRGFYDQTVVHYIEPGYMIAAGGYGADLKAKEPRTPILCEADNGLKNLKGTIAMAHHPDYVNSATCQFFINLADNPSLDYEPGNAEEVNGYCVFGEVIEGFDVLEKIAAVKVHDQGEFVNTPVEPVIIESIKRVK